MTQASAVERRPMIIDDNLYGEFRRRYGTVASELIIFYTQFKNYGDSVVRMWFPQSTYYRYRTTLIKDGYLKLEDFKG